MDFNLKRWRNESEQEDEEQQQQQQLAAVKIPKLVLDSNYSESAAPLPLFVPEPTCKFSQLSAFSDSTLLPASLSVESASPNTTRSFPSMYFLINFSDTLLPL